MEFPANSIRTAQPARRKQRIAPKLLRAAFPSAVGGDLVTRAARYTGRSERTVRNWLDETHDMKLEDMAQLLPLIGLEAFLKILGYKD